MRGSDWRSFRRALAIGRRLMLGPASSSELISYVLEIEGQEAYSSLPGAREKAFKHDRERLRTRLGVDFRYSAGTKKYELVDNGPLLGLELSEASIHALALLQQTFGGQVGEHSDIQTLLDEVSAALPEASRRHLETPGLPIDLDLQQKVDPNGISQRVWLTVWRALKSHRKLGFNYISPGYEDQQKRLHEVIPMRVQYRWGHWYLRAYRTLRRDVDGQEDRQGVHLRYRLSYIQDDEALIISPTVAPAPPRPPTYRVHYLLLPPLSRGVVSRHFDEMRVEILENGNVDVYGTCDDVWEAGHTLLSYGQYCVVLGGPELKEWMQATVTGMANIYATEDHI